MKSPKKQTDEGIHDEMMATDSEPSTGKRSPFLFDPFGVKGKQAELERRMHLLELRKQELDSSEAQLIKDRKNLDMRIVEFSRWREKLETLEMEIENRRHELAEEEKAFRRSILSGSRVGVVPGDIESSLISPEDMDGDQGLYPGVFDTITQSAAIIQRGVLKRINRSFAELIGYDAAEIVEKSFFDFIAPEGLADIERFYLHRLKGDSTVSTYKTVFFTKDNHRVAVEVRIQPITFDDEKAEIAVVKKVEK
jgi:PAS domain S-box-containing protein